MLREIGGRRIGGNASVFVIAEIGLNHGGSLDRALEMVDAAAWAGASAVKLQTIFADRLVADSCPAPAHVESSSLRDFFATFELDAEAHRALVQRARERGLAVLSTPFCESAVDLLESLEIDAYKIASGDITYDGLIRKVATTGRPVVMSTGMSALVEVGRAVEIARTAGARDIAALHCVSAYPTPAASQNLRAIVTLADYLRMPVGLSDHSRGVHAGIAAVALGACIYERHLVLEHDDDAIDRAVSSTPTQLRKQIAGLEEIRAALGTGRKVCQPAERANVVPSRRGLYTTRAIRAGEMITADDVAVLRPATSVPPSAFGMIVGSRASRDIAAGDPFMPHDVAVEQAS